MSVRKEDLIFVGIDLHKDTHTAVILDCWNTKLGEITFANTPAEFPKLVRKVKKYCTENKQAVYGLENAYGYGRSLAVWLLERKFIVKDVNEKLRNTRIIYENGEETYTYNDRDERTVYTDRNGNTTRYAYDAKGNLTQVINASGEKTNMTYDAYGNLLALKVNGITKLKNSYDRRGNLIRTEDALKRARKITRNQNGQAERIEQADGSVYRLSYDTYGNMTSIEDFVHGKTEYKYDALNRVTEAIEEGKRHTGFIYDGRDLITEIINAEGKSRKYRYDAEGNLVHMEDYDGSIQEWEYDNLDRVSLRRDAKGNEVRYTYDSMWNLTGIRYKKDDKDYMSYTYDHFGNLASAADALGRKTEYAYDAYGALVWKKDKEGRITEYSYNRNGDIEKIRYGADMQTVFKYDAMRRLTELEDWSGTVRIERDISGRIIQTADQEGRKTEYEWGASGERRSISYPDGRKTVYAYDERLRLTDIITENERIRYFYDEAGRLKEKELPGGIRTCYEYDKNGNTIKLLHTDAEGILDSFSFLYDERGNRIAAEKTRRGAAEETGSYTYEYDALNRLREVKKDGGELRSYGYDDRGNRISFHDHKAGKHTAYIYNELNQLTEETAETAAGNKHLLYYYDAEGNLTRIEENGKQIRSCSYSPMNRLASTTDREGRKTVYSHNGLGIRTEKTDADGIRTSFCMDLSGDLPRLISETTQGKGKKETRDYIWGMEEAELFYTDKKSSLYLHDEMGSTARVLPIGAEDYQELYGYDEYGVSLFGESIPGKDMHGEDIKYHLPGITQPFGYTGHRYERESESYHTPAREYLPDIGRFSSRDADIFINLSDAETLNPYQYCMNNPLLYTDPSGHVCIKKQLQTAYDIGTYFLNSLMGNDNTADSPVDIKYSLEKGITFLYRTAGEIRKDPAGWISGALDSLPVIEAGNQAPKETSCTAGETRQNGIHKTADAIWKDCQNQYKTTVSMLSGTFAQKGEAAAKLVLDPRFTTLSAVGGIRYLKIRSDEKKEREAQEAKETQNAKAAKLRAAKEWTKALETSNISYKEGIQSINRYWNQENGYFDGHWWQDEQKLLTAHQMLKLEVKLEGGINVFEEGMAHTEDNPSNRIYAIQAIFNAPRSGIWEESLLTQLETVMAKEGRDIHEMNLTLDMEAMDNGLKEYEENAGRDSGNWIERHPIVFEIIDGLALNAICFASTPKASLKPAKTAAGGAADTLDDVANACDDVVNNLDDLANTLDDLAASGQSGVGGAGNLNEISNPSSSALRKNLVDASIKVPDYPNAAHHIVAGNSPKASEARAIMQKYGVDINDASNGVFLPTAKDASSSAYHPSIHTNAYYDEINKLLSKATSKEDVLDILDFIGDELKNGTFTK